MNPAQFHSHITELWNKQNGQDGRRLDYLIIHIALSWTKPSGHETCWLGSQVGSSKRHREVDGQEKELGQRKAHGALRSHQSRLGWCLFCKLCLVKLIIKANPRRGTELESNPVCKPAVQSRAGAPAAWRVTFLWSHLEVKISALCGSG